MSSPIVRFLRNTKTLLAEIPKGVKKNVTVVIGNEAADLDSVVSAVSYAFLRECISNNEDPKSNRTYLPVIHIPRRDFSIRTDCTFALSHAFPPKDHGDLTAQLTFVDEIDLDAMSSTCDLRLVLTDHNRLAPSLSRFSHLVQGVLDHHKDEGLSLDAVPRIIEPVGSATSLVALEWKKASAAAASNLDASVATWMLAPILLDTINLEPKFGRSTPKDREAASYLLERAGFGGTELESEEVAAVLKDLFGKLQDAKFDCSGLSGMDLLKKDYKEVEVPFSGNDKVKVGVASVTWYVDAWAERDGWNAILDALKQFSLEQNLDIAIVMLAFDRKEAGGFRRELLVHVTDHGRERYPALWGTFLSELESDSAEMALECAVVSDKDVDQKLLRYQQKNIKVSRKLLLPVVERIITKL
ncbi:hypothetical protein HDU97_003150 [Phlyctochytrium planicorne]|nr:hypothetical protein HDU97_003150 [Phlyctochytrium planicorne]